MIEAAPPGDPTPAERPVFRMASSWLGSNRMGLVVVALMAHAGWGLLRESGRVLLEAAPADTSLGDIRRHLL